MSAAETFFIPILQLFVMISFIAIVGFLTLRGIIRKWTMEWKYVFKYEIHGRRYDPEDIELLSQLKGIPRITIKRELLLNGISMERINEILYIHSKIFKPEKQRKLPKIKFELDKGGK